MMRASIRPRLLDAATLLAATALLCSAAIYNRYPIVWPDTGTYLHIVNVGFRSVFYSLFVFPAIVTRTLWTVVIAQSMLMAYLLRLVTREVFGIASRIRFVGLIGALCIVSSLPWYTGFLMADIFAPMMVLGLFLMVFCADHLTPCQNGFVRIVTLVAALVHFSHLPVAIALIGTALVARFILRGRIPNPIPHLALPSAIVGVALAAMFAANYLTLGIFTYSVGGYAFFLGRLISDGPGAAYLRESCGTIPYKLCAYVDHLPTDEDTFIWSRKSPFRKVGGFNGERDEGMAIIIGTIESYPLWTLQTMISNTFEQLTQGGIGFADFPSHTKPSRNIANYYPADFVAYLNSRQNHSELFIVPALSILHMAIVAAGSLYCCMLAIVWVRKRHWLALKFLFTVSLGILLNAFVTGALSEPIARYQSRMTWLIPLVALASTNLLRPWRLFKTDV